MNPLHHQTQDPTRYRFPELFSPNHANHIERLEKRLVEDELELSVLRYDLNTARGSLLIVGIGFIVLAVVILVRS